MKKVAVQLFLMFLIVSLPACQDIKRPLAEMRVENDRVILILDRRLDSLQLGEVAAMYDLDSNLIAAALGEQKEYSDSLYSWEIRSIGKNFAEISRPLLPEHFFAPDLNDFLLFDDIFGSPVKIDLTPDELVGFNELENENAFSYSDSAATFFIEGRKRATEVFLAGSFNEWSSSSIPMIRTENGWIVKLDIPPGKYTYRYVVDGKWITDPGNLRKVKDDARGMVSVIYCPNHVFELKGYSEARNVVVTGNFNGWNRGGVSMIRDNGSWKLPVYLTEGTHVYKFIADGQWLTDPGNPDVRSDADGNMNSFLSIGTKYRFSLTGFEDAEKVVITGSFNSWRQNELLMNREEGGWFLDYAVPPGNYEYKFIVDGEWMPDPANANTTGSGDYINSVISIGSNFTFSLHGYEDAGEVIVTGSFTEWSHEKYRMIRDGGEWEYSLRLDPGKYTYKFIVDGEWMLDPANKLWEDNEYGTGNSVLWIEK